MPYESQSLRYNKKKVNSSEIEEGRKERDVNRSHDCAILLFIRDLMIAAGKGQRNISHKVSGSLDDILDCPDDASMRHP